MSIPHIPLSGQPHQTQQSQTNSTSNSGVYFMSLLQENLDDQKKQTRRIPNHHCHHTNTFQNASHVVQPKRKRNALPDSTETIIKKLKERLKNLAIAEIQHSQNNTIRDS